MKKFVVVILAFLYLLVTCGVAIQSHYCMNKLRDIHISYEQTERCSKCGMDTNTSGCCHNDVQWLKVDDSHQTAHTTCYTTPSFAIIILPPSFPQYNFTYRKSASIAYNDSGPPVSKPQDLYIIYRVFRV